MHIELSAAQKVLVRHAIETGRLSREEEAVEEALGLWELRERNRGEILAAVDEAEASVAQRPDRSGASQSLHAVADELKRGQRARASARKATGR